MENQRHKENYPQIFYRPFLCPQEEPSYKESITSLRCVVYGKEQHKIVTNIFHISECEIAQNFLKAVVSSLYEDS